MSGFESEPDPPIGRGGLTPASPSLEALSEDECWVRLQSNELGRLAIVIDGWPRIFPINYAVGEGTIVFRTGPGSKLAHGPGSAACFEVDRYDVRTESGWSVMAVGRIEDVTVGDDERSKRLRHLHVHPAAPGERSHWLALTPVEVSGRAFRGGWVVPDRHLG